MIFTSGELFAVPVVRAQWLILYSLTEDCVLLSLASARRDNSYRLEDPVL
ncbi:MAG: hypothetical protein PUP92_31830 [Rhizonema sp. PD38]|nr:hypothetical protein [Rhizonema sp. PD38]